MGREHPDYRDTIELINEVFPGVGALKVEEVAQFLNVSTKTVKRKLGDRFIGNRLNKVVLAKYMCGVKR